ncbi:MAG TPA: hypothetical protein VIR63_02075 [Pontiella sp.]
MKYILCILTLSLLITGCASTGLRTDHEAVAQIKKAALISVTITDIADDKAHNKKFTKTAAEHAVTTYTKELQKLGLWTLVPAPGIQELKDEISNLAESPITQNVLMELANKDQLPGEVDPMLMAQAVKAYFMDKAQLETIKQKMVSDVAKQVQDGIHAVQNRLVSPDNLACIPYSLYLGFIDQTELQKTANTILEQILQNYCKKHQLDGIVTVFIDSDKGEPKDIRMITGGNRVLSSFKINPTMVVRTASGKVAMNMGSPRMDDLAPMKLAMPIYIGDKSERELITNIRLDLASPDGKTAEAYHELIDKTAGKLMIRIREALQPVK